MGDTITTRVAAQYERFAYPAHVPMLAVPVPAAELHFDTRDGTPPTVLVAGCGNFEPLVVARSNPRGRTIGVDLSNRNLTLLRRRLLLARGLWALLPHRLLLQLMGRGFGAVSLRQGDLTEPALFEASSLDGVVCTGVLHHCAQPQRVLENFGVWLKPHGRLRVMVYAPVSRGPIYRLQRLFREAGITVELYGSHRSLLAACRQAIARAPADRRAALHLAFEGYRDIASWSGLVDGFFHAHDVPIPLRTLRAWADGAGLSLGRLGRQTLKALELPASVPVDKQFERLLEVDDAGQLPVNPIMWFDRSAHASLQAPKTIE